MKVLQILALILGLTILGNAQNNNESLLLSKGKIVYQRIDSKEFVEIFFRLKEKTYRAQVDENNFFEINLPKGIYQVEIVSHLVGATSYGFKNIKIGETKMMTFEVGKSDSEVIACPVFSTPDIFIESTDPELSNKIITRPLAELPKATNKTKRKTKNNK
jgi:hypothetical protein